MSSYNYKHLIVIPCHGIWKGCNGCCGDKAGELQDQWFLAPFQLEGQDHLCFKQHILKGIDIVKHDDSSILMPSGGKTKSDTELSESESYMNLLSCLMSSDVKNYASRIVPEKYARDSFENVIFLICKFYEVTGKYPEKITIIGFEFKRSRFLKNHLSQALSYPIENVEYIGNSPTPPEEIKESYFKELDQSECNFAVNLFENDWYGTKDPLLKKKLGRNPFNQKNTYNETNPLLSQFVEAISDSSMKSNEEVKSILMKSAPWVNS